MDIIEEIKNKISNFKQINGRSPQKIYFTINEENEICSLPAGCLGNKWAGLISEEGARILPKVCGLKPYWDSINFKLE